MAYLRNAVQKQKELLIKSLLSTDKQYTYQDLRNKTITELLLEHDEFTIKMNKSKNNSLRFTRSIQINNERLQIKENNKASS